MQTGLGPMLDIFILCTRRSHRGQGLATRLVNMALDSAREEGLRAAYAMGLSAFSQKIFRKMEFTEKVEILYKDYCQVKKD